MVPLSSDDFDFEVLASSPLELRSTQYQTRNHRQINVFHRIVEPGLNDLRVVQLLLQGFHGSGSGMTTEE